VGFGNAFFLWGMVLGALPVILHLAGRRKARPLRFPTLRFLNAVDRALARRYKLRERIILALRVGGICFAAFGLSLPRIRSEGAFFGERRGSTVFVIDRGFGMHAASGGATLSDKAKEAVSFWIRSLGAAERAGLFSFESGCSFTTDHTGLLERLRAFEPSFGSYDVAAACNQAWRRLAGETAPLKRLVVVSDFRKKSLPREAGIPEDCQVTALVARPDRGPDFGFRSIEVRRAGPQKRLLSAYVVNGGTEAGEAQVVIKFGGKEIFRENVVAAPRGARAVNFILPESAGGALTARIICPEDVLQANNSAFLVVRKTERIPVLVLTEGGSFSGPLDPAYWLACALDLPGGRALLRRARVQELSEKDLSACGIVFCVGLRRFEGRVASLLRTYVQAGGTLVVIVGEAIDLTSYRRAARGADPLIAASLEGFKEVRGARIAWLDESHPVLRRLARLRPPPDLGLPRFERIAVAGEIRPPARCILQLAGGAPLVVERPVGNGRTILFAFGLTPTWSTLPLRASFVPLVDSLVAEAGKSGTVPSSVICGQTVVLPAGLGILSASGPGGEVPVRTRGEQVLIGPFQRPGFYTLSGGPEKSWRTAVNVPWSDPESGFLSRSEIKRALNADTVLSLEDPRSTTVRALAVQGGRELRNLFLSIMLLCLVLEGIMAGRWAHRR